MAESRMSGFPDQGNGQEWTSDYRNPHDPMQNRILNAHSLEELTNIILLNQFDFNLVHCATAFHRFGLFRKDKCRLYSREQGALRVLIDMAKGKVFLPRQASGICRAIAIGALHEVNPDALTLFEALLNIESFQEWKPLDLAQAIEALAVLKVPFPDITSKVLSEIVSRDMSTLTAHDLTSIIEALAGLVVAEKNQVYEIIGKELLSRDFHSEKDRKRDTEAHVFNLQRLVSISIAFAKGGFRPEELLLDKLATELTNRSLKNLRCSEVANLAWAFVEMKYYNQQLFDRIATEADMKKMRLTFHQMSVLVWAFAQLPTGDNESNRRPFDCLSKEMKLRGERDIPDDILIMAVWAFAKVRYPSQALFAKIANEFGQYRSLDRLSNEELATLAWSFARLSFRHSSLYESILRSFMSRDLQCMQTSEIVALSWALACMQPLLNLKEMLTRVEGQLLSRGFSVLSNLELVDIVWAWGQSDVPIGDQTLDVIKQEVDKRGLQSFRLREVITLLCGLGMLGWNDSTLFESGAESLSTQNLDHLNTHELAMLIYGYASLGFYHRGLFDRVSATFASKDVQKIMVSDLIKSVWSFAATQCLHSVHVNKFLTLELPYPVPASERTPRNAQLLLETIVAWRQLHFDESSSLPPLLTSLSAEGWERTLVPLPKQSTLRVDVSRILQDMGYIHLVEKFISADGLPGPIRLTSNVLIEVEDDSRFLCRDGRTFRGSIALRARLWQNSGFHVIHILEEEWNNAKDDASKQALIETKFSQLM